MLIALRSLMANPFSKELSEEGMFTLPFVNTGAKLK
jgi:hypothetical protein